MLFTCRLDIKLNQMEVEKLKLVGYNKNVKVKLVYSLKVEL